MEEGYPEGKAEESTQTFCVGRFAVAVFSDARWSVLAMLHALPRDGLHQEQQDVLSPRRWKNPER